MGAKHAKLSPEQVEELTQNTHFSQKELNKWYRGFLHDSPSGTISKEEFCKIYKRFFPFGDSTAFASLLYERFSLNDNGLLEFREFVVGLSTASRGSLEEKLQWTFQLYDHNHDGVITRDEMEAVVEAIYKMVGSMVEFPEGAETPQLRVNRIFEAMDTNGDGKITEEEFIQGAKNDPSIIKALSLYDGLI
ncbi:neuronal calcium sensor 1-like isoform X2 [Halichondria panicea]|uniref:neuronal calcium sensor 1-like isoform X2 n=1 Tax=Halichondria panicea TaxID=6063 RepID=UPI00312B3434